MWLDTLTPKSEKNSVIDIDLLLSGKHAKDIDIVVFNNE